MTPARPQLAVVVAPNGLGHFRRVVAVLAELTTAFAPVPALHLFSDAWQRERMRGWRSLSVLEDAGPRWHDGVVAPGVALVPRVEEYGDGRLLAWVGRLADHDELAAADLVVSDNLGGTLAVRPDTVLMGSFLWSDVLDDAYGGDPFVDEFVRHERALLEACRPPMICVADMALPGVLARTDAIGVGWMVDDLEPAPPADPASRLVGVLGGRTGAADHLLADAVAALARHGLDVTADADLAGGLAEVPRFDYSDRAWASLGAVVCRPGMGTLTECVARQIPVLALREAGNSELAHNAAVVAERGLGTDLGVEPDPTSVAQLTVELLADQGGAIRRRMSALNTHGIAQAATFLADRLGLHPIDPRPDGRRA